MTDPRIQLTRASLAQMTPEQITAATREGRCDELLGRTTRPHLAAHLAAEADTTTEKENH